MKYYSLLFVGLAILSIIFLILALMFGQFYLFPFIFIFPFSCEFKRRFQEYSNTNETSSEDSGLEDIQNGLEKINNLIQKNKVRCPECNKEINEKNLRFCPNCGSKLDL